MIISDLDHFNYASVDSSINGGGKKGKGYYKEVTIISQDADAFATSSAVFGNASSVAVAQNAANVGSKNEIEQEVDVKTYQYFKFKKW